jgi:Domain of unknown function (DUF1707)
MCHRRHDEFTEPSAGGRVKIAGDPAWRASDSDREDVVEDLRTHSAAGRLSVAELEERIGSAYRARTLAELQPLLADLPDHAQRRRDSRAAPPRVAIAQFALLATLLIAIWAATGAGYFWPLWPIIGTLWFAGPSALGRRRRRLCATGRDWGGPARWTGPGRTEA